MSGIKKVAGGIATAAVTGALLAGCGAGGSEGDTEETSPVINQTILLVCGEQALEATPDGQVLRCGPTEEAIQTLEEEGVTPVPVTAEGENVNRCEHPQAGKEYKGLAMLSTDRVTVKITYPDGTEEVRTLDGGFYEVVPGASMQVLAYEYYGQMVSVDEEGQSRNSWVCFEGPMSEDPEDWENPYDGKANHGNIGVKQN